MDHPPEEILLNRVVDRAAGAADFDALERRGRADPRTFARLFDALRDDAGVRSGLAAAVTVADRVDLPGAPVLRPASGWQRLAAAVVIGLGIGLALAAVTKPGDGGAPPGGARATSPAEHLRAYVRDGRTSGAVLQELPEVVVLHRPGEGGGIEVLYVRRILERRVVDQAYELAPDENGNLGVVPATTRGTVAASSF